MKSKPLSLVILLQDLEFGGTQRYAIQLLKHLDQKLFSPQLWVLRGGHDMVPIAKEADVRTVWLSKSSVVTPWSLFRLMQRLLCYRPQVLYTLTVVPNIWGRIFGKITGVPTIVSGYRSLFPKQYERWLWPLSDRIICNAEKLKEIMVHRFSVDRHRIAVIPNAVDTDFFVPAPDQKTLEPSVVYVGRLVKWKDPETLLKSFKIVTQKLPDAQLEIVGNGPLKRKLEAIVQSLSLASAVRLIPGSVDIRPFLKRAWVFAISSIREASPNVIIEAMASGLPIVATRVGGIPELVEQGRSGIIIEPGDPQGLAEALIDLLQDEQKRRAMGIKAKERISANHTPGKMVRQTEEVLIEAVGDSKIRKMRGRHGDI